MACHTIDSRLIVHCPLCYVYYTKNELLSTQGARPMRGIAESPPSKYNDFGFVPGPTVLFFCLFFPRFPFLSLLEPLSYHYTCLIGKRQCTKLAELASPKTKPFSRNKQDE